MASKVQGKADMKPEQVTGKSNIFGDLASDQEQSEESDASETDQDEAAQDQEQDSQEDDENSEESDEEQRDGSGRPLKKRKKNDPEAFATAIQKILGTGLTVANRRNPILARSIESKKLDEAAAEERLDIKARKQLAGERKAALDKNHRALPNAADSEAASARVIEHERQLRKVAQSGVVRLFNAIRAAQMGAPAAGQVVTGAAGRKQQEQQKQISKQSFLSMIKGSGSGSASAGISTDPATASP